MTAPPSLSYVEEIFENHMPLVSLHVGGRVIRTTAEHRFYVRGKGWVAARELQSRDLFRSHDGQWVPVEEVVDNGEESVVYNLRVSEYHTYFVGADDWGFTVWAHNLCDALISDVGKGVYGNQEAMRIAEQIQGAVSQAAKVLEAGGTGETTWGRLYQLGQKSNWFGGKTWLEPIFKGNAIQQIAEIQLKANFYIKEAGVFFNQGSLLGSRNAAGNLLRPDFQVQLSNGSWAIFDITTAGEASKISKYAHANAPYLINIVY